MHYLVVSFTHKNSTIEIREKLAYSTDEEKERCLKALNGCEAIDEAMILSTCNRIEVMCSSTNTAAASDLIFTLLSKNSSLAFDELRRRADIFEDEGAIHHIFSVASSLDSLVVGETQIAGQLKDAHRFSYTKNYCASKLSHVLNFAFKCAAEIRNASDISSRPVSIASVAVSKAKRLVPTLKGKKALVIGSGEMSLISAKNLSNAGANVTIINRTRSKAEEIAEVCSADVMVDDYENLDALINLNEFIFTATSAPNAIINNSNIYHCNFKRYWFDMAIPRDISFSNFDDIELFVVDDLESIVQENITMREDEAKHSYILIAQYTTKFYEDLKRLSVEPIIKEIYFRAKEAATEESLRVIENGYIAKEYEKELHKACEQTLKRFLHSMTQKIRDVAHQEQSDELMQSLRFMLEIDENKIDDTRQKGLD